MVFDRESADLACRRTVRPALINRRLPYLLYESDSLGDCHILASHFVHFPVQATEIAEVGPRDVAV